jgi:gliding motility-associated-like protein
MREYAKAWIIFLVLLACSRSPVCAQPGAVAAVGTEFWTGGMFLANSSHYSLYITSEVNTTGTVHLPLLGSAIPFTVVAGETTTVSLDPDVVHHQTSETVETKGILVSAADPVSVLVSTGSNFSADASMVFSRGALGTEYRVFAHKGSDAFWGNENVSVFLIISAEDGTEVEINTSCDTEGGHLAGVPWVVQLDSGETYQVRAQQPGQDLSGSTIIGTPVSGSCRPFAVFSGASGAMVPDTCGAMDHLLVQNLPRTSWGKRYHSAPFASTTHYAYTLMSDTDGTVIWVDGTTAVTLDAGEWETVHHASGAHCFTSDTPFAVAQYMQGALCAGNGDPALMLLSAEEQWITGASLATVVNEVSAQQFIHVVTSATNIGSVSLDGSPIAAEVFAPYSGCADIVHAAVPVSEGSHRLAASEGFAAYCYGLAPGLGHAYSIGGIPIPPPPVPDTVLCTSTDGPALTLLAPADWSGPYWSLLMDPLEPLAFGSAYSFVPAESGIYAVSGQEPLSGCTAQYLYEIEVVEMTGLDLSVNGEPQAHLCAGQSAQLAVGTDTLDTYTYAWWPITGLDDPTGPTPIATPQSTSWYAVTVSNSNGCAIASDSVFVSVSGAENVSATPDTTVCVGTGFQLDVVHDLPTPATITWEPSALLSSPQSSSPVVLFDSTMTYTVVVTDVYGCEVADTVIVTVARDQGVLVSDTAFCAGEQANLDAGFPGFQHDWSTGATGQVLGVDSSGIYTATITDPQGCVRTRSFTVTINPQPFVDLGADTTQCEGQLLTLDAGDPSAVHQWSTGAIGQRIEVSTTGIYQVEAINALGCSTVDSIAVVFHPLPPPQLLPTYEACLDLLPDHVLLNVGSPGCTYRWNTGDTTGTIRATQYQTYTVVITTSEGCSVDEHTVVVEYCPSAIHIPNGFTPNGDGVNDVFMPMGTNIATMELSIFDRWGRTVHSGRDADAFWDGTMDGERVKDGVYVWKVVCRFHADGSRSTAGPVEERTGHVTVLH